jgi:hypothetical protein
LVTTPAQADASVATNIANTTKTRMTARCPAWTFSKTWYVIGESVSDRAMAMRNIVVTMGAAFAPRPKMKVKSSAAR